MAEKYDIGPRIGIEGEKEFKAAISSINKDMAVLDSELGKVAAQFGDNAGSMDALRSKSEVYNKQIDAQKEKIETLKSALKNASDEYGTADNRTKNWQIQLNKAEGELAKTENALKGTNDKLDNFGNEANKSGDEIEKAGKKAVSSGSDAEKGASKWDKLAGGLKKVGDLAGKAVVALGTAAVGAAAGVGAMTLKAAASADDINTLSKQTGLSTEEIQKFQYASTRIDVSFDTLSGSMAKLTKNMSGAKDGSGAASDAFKKLGVAITDSKGNLRDNEDVFNDAIKALGNVKNETERDALAMDLFGKSAQDLNPLILGGADTLKKLGDEAEKAGLILGQDALDNLNNLNDAMDGFKATASGSGSLFATAFAGPMADGLNTLTGYMRDLTSAFRTGGFDALSDKLGEVIADGVGKMNEAMPKILDFGMSIITKVIEGISMNIPQLVNGATQIITMLLTSLLTMLPQLMEAGLQIITELASYISDAIPQLTPVIVDTMLTIVDTLIDNIDLLVDAAVAIITALAIGLIDALPKLIDKAPEIIIKLVNALVENLPKIIEAGVKIIAELVKAIVQSIPSLVKAMPSVVAAITSALAALPAQMLSIGGSLITGLWNGIGNKLTWLKQKLSSFTDSVISSIKEFFGVHSPSTVFAGIGGYLSEGLADGISGKAGLVSAAMDKINNDLTARANITYSGAAAGGGGYGVAVSNIYMDSVLVASGTGKAQYRKNSTRARSYGVVPA